MLDGRYVDLLPRVEFQAMFGFFKKVNIRQGGDCYGMCLILRIKGGKMTLPFKHILFVGGTK